MSAIFRLNYKFYIEIEKNIIYLYLISERGRSKLSSFVNLVIKISNAIHGAFYIHDVKIMSRNFVLILMMGKDICFTKMNSVLNSFNLTLKNLFFKKCTILFNTIVINGLNKSSKRKKNL